MADIAALMKRNMDAAYAAMAKNLAENLYADPPPWARAPKPTRWQRLTWKIQRVRDAWDVLRGRANIC